MNRAYKSWSKKAISFWALSATSQPAQGSARLDDQRRHQGSAGRGKIHSDFERGFIKAEVIHFDELMQAGDMAKAKEKGLIRQEGKEYVFKDGDIVLFKFNV